MGRTRREHDSLGTVAVPRRRLWGAQTQRAVGNFHIGDERLPWVLISALAAVKHAAAMANRDLGLLAPPLAGAIAAAAAEVIAGRHRRQFPLGPWQTGSGTMSNMNLNEVLANRASELLGGPRGDGRPVHPNDHVNLGQSSNDVFPTAMHVALAMELRDRLLPALAGLRAALTDKAAEFAGIAKLGRTHLQDAVPLTLGDEFDAFATQLALAGDSVSAALPALHALAIGGTAVGTGLNTHPEFGGRVAAALAARYALPFHRATDPFAALAGHEAVVAAHGTLRTLATTLMKLANDLRWLGSGPRAGLGELRLPANEPGSSIMPGKVNPTQCEALYMVCCRVLGDDVAMGVANASGSFQLNTCKPLLAHLALGSCARLADAMDAFTTQCVRGLSADRRRIAELVERSLMLVTALAPHIGYDRASAIAQRAERGDTTLRVAALAEGVSATDFDRWVRVEEMLGARAAAG